MLYATSSLMAMLSWHRVARAQAAPLPDAFTLAPPQGGALVQGWGADPLAPGRYAVASSLHTRPHPAPADAETENTSRVFGPSTLELLGGFGTPVGIDVWGGITGANTHSDGSQLETPLAASLGHARLLPRLSLSAPDERLRAAVLVDLALPLRAASLAAEGLHLEPRLALAHSYDWIQPVLNSGYRVHLGGSAGRELDALTAIAGAVVPISNEWAGVTELAARWHPAARGQLSLEHVPTEARAAARFARASWAVELGAGLNLVAGQDAPSFRMFAAVNISPAPEPAPPEPPPLANPSSSLAGHDDECAMALRNWKGGKTPAACAVGETARVDRDVDSGEQMEGREPAVASCDGSEAPGSPGCDKVQHEAPLPQIDTRVYFAPNSYTVDPSAQSVLDHVAQQMKSATPELRFWVVGHSDTKGPAAFNWQLSEARAVLVRRLLLRRGVPWRRVTVAWYGPTRPLDDGTGPEVNAKNRRVEFEAERVRSGLP